MLSQPDPLIQKLIARLRDQDPVTRRNAAGALRLHGRRAAAATSALTRLLADEDPGVQAEARRARPRRSAPVVFKAWAAAPARRALVAGITGDPFRPMDFGRQPARPRFDASPPSVYKRLLKKSRGTFPTCRGGAFAEGGILKLVSLGTLETCPTYLLITCSTVSIPLPSLCGVRGRAWSRRSREPSHRPTGEVSSHVDRPTGASLS
jgi:hypothetical protein